MPDISKITLPSGNTYDIKDATARQMISGGVSFIIAWDGNSLPVVANIPEGVVAYGNPCRPIRKITEKDSVKYKKELFVEGD